MRCKTVLIKRTHHLNVKVDYLCLLSKLFYFLKYIIVSEITYTDFMTMCFVVMLYTFDEECTSLVLHLLHL